MAQSSDVFDWQGHRGCRGLRPENSISAFIHALSFPELKTLEMDVVISRDKQVVVSHDPWFNPGLCDTNMLDNINLYHIDYEAIRHVDCGSKGHVRFPVQLKEPAHKPTLNEVIRAVHDHCLKNQKTLPAFNIEIKSQPEWDGKLTPPVQEFCDLVAEEFLKLGLKTSSSIQSFDVRALQYIHHKYPEITLAFLVEKKGLWAEHVDRLGFTPHIYSPHYALLTKKSLREMHDQGLRVIPWTVNEVKIMRKLLRWGVDGIITDYPNLIKEAK